MIKSVTKKDRRKYQKSVNLEDYIKYVIFENKIEMLKRSLYRKKKHQNKVKDDCFLFGFRGKLSFARHFSVFCFLSQLRTFVVENQHGQ